MDQIPMIQISDLHFDEKIISNRMSRVPGYQTHDLLLCHGLVTQTEDLRALWDLEDEDCLRLVVSGDVTANGTPGEFAVAHSFILSHWRLRRIGPGEIAGLNIEDENLAMVLGNHDHWHGRRVPPGAFNPRLFGRHAHHPPWRKTWSSTQGGLLLELYGIESNSGVSNPAQSMLAQGKISDEDFDALERLLGEEDPDPAELAGRRVRAIVMHHSPSYKGGYLPGCLSPSVLESQSDVRLRQIAAQYRIAAILTGHTHDAHYQLFEETFDGQARQVRELRSPTTLQGPAAKTGAGFLAHQLKLQETGEVVWSVWLYSWDGALFLPETRRPWRQFTVT